MAKHFTDDETIILKKNPYISNVSTSTITYTSEFRGLFINEYQNLLRLAVVFVLCVFTIIRVFFYKH